ncbi:hypothetical protein TWF694_009370 [Orbilia ellipsospora]|uniref:Stress-response A/B barrel domain-containing protein n=1 Tax=Orbilia ellipsospora TaxID=2528407 RepID=A0AAV9XEP5_9PEZI
MAKRNQFKVDNIPRSFFAGLIFILVLTTLYVQSSPTPTRHKKNMPVTHILLVSFKKTATREAVLAVSKQMVALKDTCVDPQTGKPYILSAKGGKNNSPETNEKGMTHGFILEFKNEDDRNYFLQEDPSHKKFVEAIIPQNSDFLVLDFTEEVY